MKSKLVLCTAILLLVQTFFAQDSKRPVEIDDFFAMKSVGNPQVSPDGKWIAYTLSTTDLKKDKSETRIWMIPAAGGEAIPMTAKGYSASNPRWSPDGKYLSFLAKRSESGEDKTDSEDKPQVWTLNRLGGEAQQLTKVKQGVSGYEWSPDSKRLVLLITDPKPHELTEDPKDDKKPRPHVIDRLQFKRDYAGYLDRYRTHLYVFDVESKSEPKQITSGDYDDSDPAWSPDGKLIAFESNRSEEPDRVPNSDIWVVSADNNDKGATLLQLTKNPREDNNPQWSPDGRMITYGTVTADLKTMWYAVQYVATVPASGGQPKLLTANLDRNVLRPRFSEDGSSIWFIIEDSGEQHLASIPANGGDVTRHVRGKDVVQTFDFAGGTMATLTTQPGHPNEIFTFSNGRHSQVTTANKELLDKLQLSEVEEIRYRSVDGTEVEAFLYKPIGFDPSMKYPLILNPHGGPVSQYDYGFDFDAQLWAANGYLVLLPNPRGSSGYGQAFSYALFADWGNLDFQDVMAGVDHVISRGYADPEKLGVGGWSYGGILTNYVITKSTRFKAAVSGASEALYRSNYGHDHYQMWWEVELGLPWENAAAWERISPFNDVAKITTPTLWIGGSDDWNVPILNSEQMYQAMKRLGRETQLVVYPGEHHGIRRPTFQKDRFQRFLGWFDKYIKGVERNWEEEDKKEEKKEN
ncbi:MAG: S9 family peptidase [Acidobacteria bacterium]|nr:MAG: S9 family peptidase [Acidobacteriota bacterium]REJ98133.1 MAG: S9 family peptidase [Acidobacteriota bacterium]REK16876.1 MAG: S9 family peptidase [Acidobacteriota bacterium]REK42787.1 MAG: S9 family peptidase [Acidobacteriota bacterium]